MPASLYKAKYADKLVPWFESSIEQGKLPTLESFAVRHCKVCPDTMIEWQRKHPDFDIAVKQAMAIQKDFLMSNSVSGKLKEASSIFLLKANHGMRDHGDKKSDEEVSQSFSVNIFRMASKDD